MAKEPRTDTPANEQCRQVINDMTSTLWGALITPETWNFRQAGAYGMPLTENPDYKKQDAMIRKILEDLGPRAEYLNKAYHFIDNLTAFAAMMIFEGDSLKKFIKQTKTGIKKLGKEFEGFLEKDSAEAFEIKFDFSDQENPRYTISDLSIDTKTLGNQWGEFSTQVNSILA